MHHNYNIRQHKLVTWASPEVLLSWTAVLWDCLVTLPAHLTGWPVRPLEMLLALDWLRPCSWLGASESGSCKVKMTGEVECKGGPTFVGLCLMKQQSITTLAGCMGLTRLPISSRAIPCYDDCSGNLILRCVEMKAYLYMRLNILLQGCTILACCNGCSDFALGPEHPCSFLYILVQLCKTHGL